ncbi:MAG: tRNA (guanosine(37)-N1)-methyltransferase TrmD, partial [Candidatus Omnitrophica bacterium]|nr:tRNA (guanosine(37)-N1)-methyltransferase TrmD [Candidatus Omnitrophota bacterium]
GGGPGMIMSCQPIFDAVATLKPKTKNQKPKIKVILLSPRGKRFDQGTANRLAKQRQLILICGRYEGVDERVEKIITDKISIGDYVLTGGEIPAMVVVDAVTRLLAGVLGNKDSAASDSFQTGLLEYPQYTRPREYNGLKVPNVLLSGNHERIKTWRLKESLRLTRKSVIARKAG